MRKLILAATAVIGFTAFSACIRENRAQFSAAGNPAGKENLLQAYLAGELIPVAPKVIDRSNLAQADGNGS